MLAGFSSLSSAIGTSFYKTNTETTLYVSILRSGKNLMMFYVIIFETSELMASLIWIKGYLIYNKILMIFLIWAEADPGSISKDSALILHKSSLFCMSYHSHHSKTVEDRFHIFHIAKIPNTRFSSHQEE